MCVIEVSITLPTDFCYRPPLHPYTAAPHRPLPPLPSFSITGWDGFLEKIRSRWFTVAVSLLDNAKW